MSSRTPARASARPLVRPLARRLARPLVHSYVYSYAYSSARTFICTSTRQLIGPLVRLLVHSYVHSHVHSYTHSFTRTSTRTSTRTPTRTPTRPLVRPLLARPHVHFQQHSVYDVLNSANRCCSSTSRRNVNAMFESEGPGGSGSVNLTLALVKGTFVVRTLNALFHHRSIWWPSRYSETCASVSAACGRDWTHVTSGCYLLLELG